MSQVPELQSNIFVKLIEMERSKILRITLDAKERSGKEIWGS